MHIRIDTLMIDNHGYKEIVELTKIDYPYKAPMSINIL
jgi:hypothetical protein